MKVNESGLEDDDKSRIDKLLAGWGENDVWKCGRDLEKILYEKERCGNLWLFGEKCEEFGLKSPPGEKLLPVDEGSSNRARLSRPPLR